MLTCKLWNSIGLEAFDTSRMMFEMIKKNESKHFKYMLSFKKTRSYIKHLASSYCKHSLYENIDARQFVDYCMNVISLDDFRYTLDIGLLNSSCCKEFCLIKRAFSNNVVFEKANALLTHNSMKKRVLSMNG